MEEKWLLVCRLDVGKFNSEEIDSKGRIIKGSIFQGSTGESW